MPHISCFVHFARVRATIGGKVGAYVLVWRRARQRFSAAPGQASGVFGKRTRKPNSVLCGHSSRRRVTANAHQRPTRRFRHLLSPLRHRADAERQPGSGTPLPSLFGLAPCGVYHASDITGGAVRSYRTFSPLPRRESSYELPDVPPKRGSRGGMFSVALAVCEL